MWRIKGKEKKWGQTVKIKMQPNKIKLMIESVRQKNSAPIAKRISGDGAFLSIQFIYFCVEFILQNVPIRRRDSADDLYIWAHSALICLKKQFFVE